jgi:hypothetical protein
MTEVTDPALLAQLNADDGEVTDPAILKQLNETTYAGDVARNIVPSAQNYFGNMAHAVMHPIDTAGNVADVLAGGLQNALPESVVQTLGEDKQSRAKADAVGQFFKDRYGSWEQAQEAFRTDPVGVAGDLSMLLGGVSGAAKLSNPAAAAAGLTKPLDIAAKVTNPMWVAGKGVHGTLTGVRKGAAKVLGDVTTGAGYSALENAYSSTKAGGQAAKDYWANLRGGEDIEKVVETARQGLDSMRKSMIDEYKVLKNNPDPHIQAKVAAGVVPRSAMGWADDTTPLNFQGVEDAYLRAINKFSFKGITKPGVGAVADDVRALLDHWKAKAAKDPSFITAEGLDQLKQHLNDIYPKDIANRAGRSFATEVVKEVKKTIINQMPQYKKSMLKYWDKSDELDQIQRELSLGERASVGTALRKLQSIMRNNANTSFGYRENLAGKLAEKGGVDIMPALSGQALNPAFPRGLKPLMADVPIAYGAASVAGLPAALASMFSASPRLAGEIYGGLGTLAKWTDKAPYSPGMMNAIERLQNGGQ